MKESSLEELINELELIAKSDTDGHVTMLKFTTGWKVALGTPNLDIGEERAKISSLKGHLLLKDAIRDAINNKISLYEVTAP